jgi:enoyl-CoA hydratase/carnithine racemase
MPTIRLEREDRVAVITIDNPRRRNAFSEDMNRFYASLSAEVEDGLRLEIEAARVAAGSADAEEGLQAFLEKRRPTFD